MGFYDDALVCLNGHVINDSATRKPERNSKFCDKCGAAAINSCPACNTMIRGYYYVPGVVGLITREPTPAAYCHECGKPYLWTEDKLKAIQEAIELSEISAQEKAEFGINLPDIVADTPRTKVAALKLKVIGEKIGKELWGVVKDIIVEIGSEAAKKTMGL